MGRGKGKASDQLTSTGVQTAGGGVLEGVGGGRWLGRGRGIVQCRLGVQMIFWEGRSMGKDRARPFGWLRLPMLTGKAVSGPCPKFSVLTGVQ